MRLLIIEDNLDLRGMVSGHLASAGFAVDGAGSVARAREAMALTAYDLLIIDLGLPGEDGSVLLDDADAGTLPPVIVLTARDSISNRVRILNSGADDYVIKPFDLLELEARIHAVLRRPKAREDLVLRCGDLSLVPNRGDILVGETAIVMPRRERALLEELLRQAGKTIVREVLEDRLYPFGDIVTPNALEQIVSRVRRRLMQAHSSVRLETIRGIGYRLSAPAPRHD